MKTNNFFFSSGFSGSIKFWGIAVLLSVILFSGCETNQSVAPEDQGILEKGGYTLTAELLGINEVPSAGDPDGSGTSTITIMKNSQIAFEINVSGITLPAIAAHIHHAAAGVAGPVVVPLSAPDAQGFSSGVIENVDPELLKDIKKNPQDYYVNVHTTDYPAGAVRGQLEK